jgi:predicted membrane-bound spermidine synthase
MAKMVPGQRSLYVAAAIIIIVKILWALVLLPRLGVHPEAIKDGVDHSSKSFFKVLLMAAVVLVACALLSQLGGRVISGIISGLLYLAAGLIFFHDFMALNGAVFYLEEYEGLSTEAIMMLICVGANLIGAILALRAGNKYRQLALPRNW